MKPEFCPKCRTPIDTIDHQDTARLCPGCGWFGDTEETNKVAEATTNMDNNVLQTLALYRNVCRQELLAEAGYNRGLLPLREFLAVKACVDDATQNLMFMYRAMQKPPRVLDCINGTLAWPEDWVERHYNCRAPCDVLVGPCVCGACHSEKDKWVQATLRKHHAVINYE